MKKRTFTFIRDKYRDNRGNYSFFYNIYCENCGIHILLYQKDGPGPLKRMYLDRIIAPEELTYLDAQERLQNLECKQCKRMIAIPIVYEKEGRKAYALLAYVTIKKRAKGIYPPDISRLEVK